MHINCKTYIETLDTHEYTAVGIASRVMLMLNC